MISEPRDPGVDTLREAARHAVELASLRSIARDIGMTAMGLRHFLEGGIPQPTTRRKLYEWYLLNSMRKEGSVRVAAARAALDALLEGLPEHRVEEARNALLDTIAGIYQRSSIPPPQWIESLRGGG